MNPAAPKASCWLLATLGVVAPTACDRTPSARGPATDQARPDPVDPLRPAPDRGSVAPRPGVASYVIAARLDAEVHRIEATATLRWQNTSTTAVSSIPMHLYLNGFRSQDTAWMREGRLATRTGAQSEDDPWGYIDVHSVRMLGDPGSTTETASTKATPLTFAERDEPSLMDVTLPQPLAPGQTLQLQMTFTTQLPRVFARSGYARDFHMVAQWFPKPGVLDADGTWHAHPFTFHSEFFADFGDYVVELDVPYTMAVGATGTRRDAYVQGDRRIVTYHAAMVHDFAWVAAPDLVEQTREHDGISIRQLIPSQRQGDGAAHLDMAAATLTRMEARFSPYPWSTLTIVHPPPYARGAGGMEYPTLFTSGDIFQLPPLAETFGFSERYSGRYVTAHELGHQWFQGLLASDEYTQPWLDEGLNSFANLMVYFDEFADDETTDTSTTGTETIAGEDVQVVSLAGHPLSMGDAMRLQQRWRPLNADVSDQTAAAFSPLYGEYGAATYGRTAAWMATLRALTGRVAFDAAMRTYAERFRFRHPTGDDFQDALVHGLGERVALSERDAQGHQVTLDVRDFLHQALRTTAEVDFELDRIDIVPRLATPPAGFFRVDGALVKDDAPLPSRSVATLADDAVESLVVIRRRGAFRVPVVIEVHTDQGPQRWVWSGQPAATTLRLPGVRVRSVVIDPDGDLYLEGNRLNNTAFARDVIPARALPTAMGDVTQAAALAVLGGFGP